MGLSRHQSRSLQIFNDSFEYSVYKGMESCFKVSTRVHRHTSCGADVPFITSPDGNASRLGRHILTNAETGKVLTTLNTAERILMEACRNFTYRLFILVMILRKIFESWSWLWW
jgi:hypothetical protein